MSHTNSKFSRSSDLSTSLFVLRPVLYRWLKKSAIRGILSAGLLIASAAWWFGQASGSGALNTDQTANASLSIQSSANPSATGQSVTFTVFASPVSPSTDTPTGQVQFKVDGANLGAPQTLLSSPQFGPAVATASVSTAALSITPTLGPGRVITAVYSGDANFTGSTATLANPQVVLKGDTAVAILSSANPSLTGQSVIFTANVSAAGQSVGVPTHTVQFEVDGAKFGPELTLVNGSASLTTSSLTAATHTVDAVYLGDDSFNPSTSGTLKQAVNNPVPSITTLTPNAVLVNGPGLNLTINGSGFVPGASVQWNSEQRQTVFVSATQLKAVILDIDITQVGPATVTVTNPAPGGGLSAGATVQVVNVIMGDVNGDGVVDASDLVMLANVLAGNMTLKNTAAADVFQDGVINASDLVTLANFLAGNISKLPVRP